MADLIKKLLNMNIWAAFALSPTLGCLLLLHRWMLKRKWVPA